MNNSIFYEENNLPGVLTEIDSKLSSDYDTSLFGTTDSVVVIGTAFDGPVGIATPVYSVEHASYSYGKNYDPKTRKEVSLVTGIQEAWDQGCRTIYAMRINGKDMYKYFDFCVKTNLRLRIKSRYPSNLGKQVYLKYDNTNNLETITIYKPASRATIKEKRAGMVENENAVMVTSLALSQDYSFTKDSKLIDVIEEINGHAYNNVIELDIVDENGNVVTDSAEAYELTLGCLYPGVYFMGRDKSLCEKVTEVTPVIVFDNEEAPFDIFNNKYYNVLHVNTDVSLSLPIYCEDETRMRNILQAVGITSLKKDDYLENAEVSNRAFAEDEVDYEETNLSNFEKYLKLGKGFAITAVAQKRTSAEDVELVPKIIEAPVDDPQRIVNTGDGIYSTLEDVKIKYHVLAQDICANSEIKNKMPKPEDFKVTISNSIELFNGLIKATRKVDQNDKSNPRSYEFNIAKATEKPVVDKTNLYVKGAVEVIGHASSEEEITSLKNLTPGEKCLLVKQEPETTPVLYVVNEKGVLVETQDQKYAGTKELEKAYMAGYTVFICTFEENKLKFTPVTVENASNTIGDKTYFLADNGKELFVGQVFDVKTGLPFMATADVALDKENQEDLFVFYQDNEIGKNYIVITYPHFDSISLNDFVETLNNSSLNKLFNFELTSKGLLLRDEYVIDADKEAAGEDGTPVLGDGPTVGVTMNADRTRGYDYTKHIPYYTTDNFARHLAQHCMYTEVKTYPTHGIIGVERITDISKPNLAKVIQNLKEFNWSMYIKNNYGRNILDKDNLPYHIGRAVTVTVFQSPVMTVSNYRTISNGATAYAGMISSLDIAQSSTGQPINIVPTFEFSRSQIQSLSDMGFMTVRNSFTQGYVITDGITMAQSDDLLRRLFNTRVMHFVEDLIRAACEPFIGKANSPMNRNSIQTAINSKLTPLLDVLLRRFSFKIRDDGTADQYTYIDVDYNITTMNEIREINNHIKVQN